MPEIRRWRGRLETRFTKIRILRYRVVNAKGELAGAFAFGGAGRQADLLRADGIVVVDDRVDLKQFGIRIRDGVILE